MSLKHKTTNFTFLFNCFLLFALIRISSVSIWLFKHRSIVVIILLWHFSVAQFEFWLWTTPPFLPSALVCFSLWLPFCKRKIIIANGWGAKNLCARWRMSNVLYFATVRLQLIIYSDCLQTVLWLVCCCCCSSCCCGAGGDAVVPRLPPQNVWKLHGQVQKHIFVDTLTLTHYTHPLRHTHILAQVVHF